MSTPGVSLFQDAECIKVNTSLERADEEEALVDQRRREVELGNLLQNAFDDLDDDEKTIDSISNSQTDYVDHNRNENHRYEHIDAGQHFEDELHQLNALLDSKTRELETFKRMANDESKKRDEIQKRLTITEAELDRALASKTNTHELLVESKEKCSNLESMILKLKNEKKHLETENNSLLGKLETAQTLLSDVQRKYDMVERDLNRNNDRNAELKRKNMEERHRAELEIVQQQIEQIANKLEKKTVELENMNTRYRALQNSYETMLVDKASKINDLNNALNESQKKCDELLSRQDYFQENVRLQKLVASLQDQIISMEKTIATLNERLEFTTAELDVMDSVLHQHNMEDTPRKSPSQTHGTVGSTPLNTANRVGSLKDELYRALANIKNKREEIKKLQRTLEERNAEIKFLKDEENKSMVQITTLKENKIRLENRVKVLEEEFDELRTKSMNKSVNNNLNVLGEELRKLREEKNSLELRCNELEEEKNSYEMERKKLDVNLKNVEVDLEELKQEHESMRRNYENILKENKNLRNRTTADSIRLELEKHKFLLKDAQTENDRLKNLYVDIVNAKENLSFEFTKLQGTDSNRKLKEEQEKVESLQRVVKLAELKFEEITRILEKEKISHEREVADLKEKLEKERKDNTKDEKDVINTCKKCFEYLAERTTLEIESLELKNQISTKIKEVNDLVHQLKESKAINSDLSDKLKMSQECQEGLIKELQKKANQFGEYMKSQSSSSDKSVSPKRAKPSPTSSTDKCVATSPELERNENKKIEARIRDEMAKIFAVELKRYQIKLNQNEEHTLALKNEYEKVFEKLKQRQSDVDILKQAILAERENFEKLLAQKVQQCKDIMQQQQDELQTKDEKIKGLIRELNNRQAQIEGKLKCKDDNQQQKSAMQLKYRDELREKDNKIDDLIRELSAVYEQIQSERQSMKAVMAQWEAKRMNTDIIENEWKNKLEELKKEYDSKILALLSNYDSLKRCFIEYKRYTRIRDICDSEAERVRLEQDLASKRSTDLVADKGDSISKRSTVLALDKEETVSRRIDALSLDKGSLATKDVTVLAPDKGVSASRKSTFMVADRSNLAPEMRIGLVTDKRASTSKRNTFLVADKGNLASEIRTGLVPDKRDSMLKRNRGGSASRRSSGLEINYQASVSRRN